MGKIICIVIAILAILGIIIVSIYNKIQYSIIKLNKSDSNIQKALNDKYYVLERYIDMIVHKIAINDDSFKSFNEIDLEKISNIDLDRILLETYNDIKMLIENNKKELKDINFKDIDKEIFNLDIVINSCKKYYNEKLIIYNKLINYFPTNIMAKILKCKEKEYYLEEQKEELKILKEK